MNRVKGKKPGKGGNYCYPPDDGSWRRWAYNHVCVDCRVSKRFGDTYRSYGAGGAQDGDYRKGEGLLGPCACPQCGEKMMEIRRHGAPKKQDKWWTKETTRQKWERHKFEPYFLVVGPGHKEDSKHETEELAELRAFELAASTRSTVHIYHVGWTGRKRLKTVPDKGKKKDVFHHIRKQMRSRKGYTFVEARLYDESNDRTTEGSRAVFPDRVCEKARGQLIDFHRDPDRFFWRWKNGTEVYSFQVSVRKPDPLHILAGVTPNLFDQWLSAAAQAKR